MRLGMYFLIYNGQKQGRVAVHYKEQPHGLYAMVLMGEGNFG